MTNKRFWILIWVLALLPAVITAVLYARLPAMIPTHWNIDGSVTYGSKTTILMLAGMSPAMALLFWVLPKIDPRKKNYEKFRGYYDGFILVLMLFLLMMDGVVLSESLWPGHISVGRVVNMAVGLLFIFLGNLMPKVKNNFFMGVRTPWTLSDPDVWNRTNRLGGKLFFWFGLVITLGSLFLPETALFAIMMLGVLTVSAVPITMSFLWYRKKQGKDDE